jgi:hypothetical protein
MHVLLFTNGRQVQKAFSSFLRSRGARLDVHPVSGIAKVLKGSGNAAFVYVDISGCGEEAIDTVVRSLKKAGGSFGFIDPKDSVEDIALLFHRGASDYLGGKALLKGVSAVRVKRAQREKGGGAFAAEAKTPRAERPAALKTPTGGKESSALVHSDGRTRPERKSGAKRVRIPQELSWVAIEEGKEYSFCFMYVELDDIADLRKSIGDQQIDLTIQAFREYLDLLVAQGGGKTWMWNDFSGVALFPFDGSRCEAVLPCIRMVLARRVFSAEFAFLNTLISFRVALHIGNTVYRRKGDTGTIVSDAVNSVFHLGRRFARAGNFYITGAVYDSTPDCLKTCFRHSGEFDGNRVYRMRLPL